MRLSHVICLAGHGFVIEPGGETILWRGPVYPLVSGFVWQLAGDSANHEVILIAQVLVDAATALLIVCIGKHFFGNKTGLLAAVIFVFYPISVITTAHVFCLHHCILF